MKRSCPNCAEAYREGYQEAWKQFEKQLLEIQERRPVQIIMPKNSHLTANI